MSSAWKDAEHLAASWMRGNGFRDARVTQGGADGGIDITAYAAIAQVKHEAKPVGRPALQRLVGARGRKEQRALLFFSRSGYSAGALAYADHMDVALFVYTSAEVVSPVNAAARRLVVRASAEQSRHDKERQPREAARIADKLRRNADLMGRANERYASAAGMSRKERRQSRAIAKAAARAEAAASRAYKRSARLAARAHARRLQTKGATRPGKDVSAGSSKPSLFDEG